MGTANTYMWFKNVNNFQLRAIGFMASVAAKLCDQWSVLQGLVLLFMLTFGFIQAYFVTEIVVYGFNDGFRMFEV